MLISTGCSVTARDADALKGKIAAGVVLPEWPTECRQKEIHAALSQGEDIRSILKRERAALARLNKRVDACARYYDNLRRNLLSAKERT